MSRNSLGESSGRAAFKVAGRACGKALWQEAAWYICVTNAERASVGNMVLGKGMRPEHTSVWVCDKDFNLKRFKKLLQILAGR